MSATDRRWTTQELHRAARQGAVIRGWGDDEVRWDPRRPRDPQPWEGASDVRYSTRECHPEHPGGNPWTGPQNDDHGSEEGTMGDRRRIEWRDERFNSTSGRVNGVDLFRTLYSSDRSHGPEEKYRLTHRLPVTPSAEWGFPSHEDAQRGAERILVQLMDRLGFIPKD